MTTLEKAARAAHVRLREMMGFRAFRPWEEIPRTTQEIYIESQRAAISAALLDPSDEVVEAVSRALSRIGGDPTEADWPTWEPETRVALRAAGVKITGRTE